MKLNNKIHLLSSVLSALLIIALSLCIYAVFSRFMLSSTIERSEAEIRHVEQGIRSANEAIQLADLLRAYVPVDGMIRIAGEDGSNIAAAASPSAASLNQQPVSFQAMKTVDIITLDKERWLHISIPLIWRDGTIVNLQLYESLASMDQTLRMLRFVLLAVTLLAMIPVIISGRFLSRLILAPIAQMIRTMRTIIQSGRFQTIQIHTKSKDELMELGQTFNRMIELLQSNFERQEQFVSNASHELRTPLTVIESYAALLKRKGTDYPEIFAESVEAIHSEALRMREMTEQLLLLAKSTEQWDISIQMTDIPRIVQETAHAFEQAHKREIVVHSEGAVEGVTDRNLLKQLLFILLDNARKYSDAPIEVKVEHGERNAPIIRVIDQGIGIPKEELDKVFERYYRVEQARSRKAGGTGLGLPLAKTITDAIGAKLMLHSEFGKGTTAEIRLPAASEMAAMEAGNE